MEKNIPQLIKQAVAARQQAYAPYSGFLVGAALLCADGRVYTGCNIENAAYPAGNCAERTALFKAVSEGEREFAALALVGGKADGMMEICPPCGICRQVLAEFVGAEFPIILGFQEADEPETKEMKYRMATLSDLLPLSFSRRNLTE